MQSDHEELIARAALLGIRRPNIDPVKTPQLWECWRDRVWLAENQKARGHDPSAMIRDAIIYGGSAVPDAKPVYPGWPEPLRRFFEETIPTIVATTPDPQP